MLFVILMYAVWSSVFSLGKTALESSPPIFLTAARMLVAAFLLLGFVLLRKRTSLNLTLKQWLSLFLLGVMSIYLTNVLEFWGLQYLPAGKACFIYSLSPFFAALFSYLHFGEKMNNRKWLGFLIGFVGFIPVLGVQSAQEGLMNAFSIVSWPALALMGAALCSVYGWVLLRIVVKDSSISPMTANGVSMLFGGSLALVHSLFVDTWAPLPIYPGKAPAFWQSIAFITLISNLVCYNLYGWLLKRYTATFLSFVGLLSPIFASLTGWMLLGESLNPVIFLSTGIVSIGLWNVYRAELKQGYIVSPAKKDLAGVSEN